MRLDPDPQPIGASDDVYEKEADAMIDKVMRMPMPESIHFSSAKNTVSRKCAECEEEEKLHRKESSRDSTAVGANQNVGKKMKYYFRLKSIQIN